MKHIIILGGGITGLAAAFYLSPYAQVTLIEKSARLGGWIRSVRHGPFLFECGPRGFRSTGQEITHLMQILGLQTISSSPISKTRFIAHGGHLKAITPWFLFKHGMLQALCKDLTRSPSSREDETLEAFFRRHFGRRLTQALMPSLIRGIFGGDYRQLSARSCCPILWERDQTHGSILPSLLSRASLLTCVGGMERLVDALGRSIHYRLNTAVIALGKNCVFLPDERLEADVIVSALPASALCPLLGISDPLSYATLSTVNFGWHRALLQQRGYGFLVPDTRVMGMTWDSEIFPQHGPGTRLCTMISGEAEEAQLIADAQKAVKHYCGITAPPDAILTSTARHAIPQYALGHHRWLHHLKQHLPRDVYAIGSSFHGVSLNDCIADAARLAHVLST